MNSNARILIVEDEKIPAEFLKEFLLISGYDVLGICDNGADAIRKACELKPDLILMDIMLKDNISGSEASLKISSIIDTKIIFLTAHSNEELIEYALDSGAVNYLIKPYKDKQILTALQLALNNKNRSIIEKNPVEVKLQDGYSYNYKTKRLLLNNSEVAIGSKSIKIIDYLCNHINNTISPQELCEYIYARQKETSSLRTLISRLNKTLNTTMIKNNSGIGYTIISL